MHVPDVSGIGIIPARAGFTNPRRNRIRPGRDHPRSRGVYRRHSGRIRVREGSSPLARGLRSTRMRSRSRRRIIPARAGFTVGHHDFRVGQWDHPRSRGVYPGWRASTRWERGSSPLARGLPGIWKSNPRPARIIPARAGFTKTPRRFPVHDPGSSPLARGLPGNWKSIPRPARIIPARAGFTSGRSFSTAWPWDHPRSRGVYADELIGGLMGDGSSPLARGLPPWGPQRSASGRIIPARAGFTLMISPFSLMAADHPRSRGVYVG